MACEVESHRYLFHMQQWDDDNPDVFLQNMSSEPQRPSFAYNPVHDLESLWWIWAWVMYFYVDKDGMSLSPEQAEAFQSLFPDYIPAKRVQILLDSLQEDVPLTFQEVIRCTEMIRRMLEKTYVNMEMSLPPDYTRFLPRLMRFFLHALELAVDHAGNTKLYIPLEHQKRKEPERDDENLASSNSNKRNKQR